MSDSVFNQSQNHSAEPLSANIIKSPKPKLTIATISRSFGKKLFEIIKCKLLATKKQSAETKKIFFCIF